MDMWLVLVWRNKNALTFHKDSSLLIQITTTGYIKINLRSAYQATVYNVFKIMKSENGHNFQKEKNHDIDSTTVESGLRKGRVMYVMKTVRLRVCWTRRPSQTQDAFILVRLYIVSGDITVNKLRNMSLSLQLDRLPSWLNKHT